MLKRSRVPNGFSVTNDAFDAICKLPWSNRARKKNRQITVSYTPLLIDFERGRQLKKQAIALGRSNQLARRRRDRCFGVAIGSVLLG